MMESINQCHCCLQRPSAKDLRTPYTRLGITEIYSVMIEECFVIKLTSGNNGKSGICEVCLGRLREACLFKMQVQNCQAELQERLEGGLSVNIEDEECLEQLPENGACSEPSLCATDSPQCRGCMKTKERSSHVVLECSGVAPYQPYTGQNTSDPRKTSPRSYSTLKGSIGFLEELGWQD
ncbi:uncharacterized protein LOC133531640 isoform X6 [Cydia pomonella]|uniref:uncharacterized protein LOC133531640 isoform X6 n=1 Tax=Cydia pomonella TaxID=82600 RepID=UPI002ADDF2C4|nr:uncharacterized protein LOC133531640 isoform X6 [Cydia pomonella]